MEPLSVKKPISMFLSILIMGIVFYFTLPALCSAVEITYYVLDKNAHPFQIVNDDSEVSGIITDIVEELFRDSSHRFDVKVFPVLRLERHLFSQQSANWITYGSPVWKSAVGTLSNESLFTVKHVLITGKDSEFKFRKIEDLYERHIALLFGFDYPGLNPYLRYDYESIKTKKVIETEKQKRKIYKIYDSRPQTYKQAFILLDNNRVDGFVEMDLRIRYNLKATGRNPVDYIFFDFSSIIAPYDIHLRLSKTLSKIAKDEIDNKIKRFKVNGKIKEIINRYK